MATSKILGTFLVIVGACCTTFSIGALTSKNVVYKDRIVQVVKWREPGGDCMNPGEQGSPERVAVKEYSDSTEKCPKCVMNKTFVTFHMSDASHRICSWDYVDIKENFDGFETGVNFSVKGGDRVV